MGKEYKWRLSEEKEVSHPDLPISKSTPCRALYFLKRAKACPSKLLPARRKTIDCCGIHDFPENRDRLWTEIPLVESTSAWDTLGIAVGKLKEAGTIHWSSPNTGATNESGFTALPSSEPSRLLQESRVLGPLRQG